MHEVTATTPNLDTIPEELISLAEAGELPDAEDLLVTDEKIYEELLKEAPWEVPSEEIPKSEGPSPNLDSDNIIGLFLSETRDLKRITPEEEIKLGSQISATKEKLLQIALSQPLVLEAIITAVSNTNSNDNDLATRMDTFVQQGEELLAELRQNYIKLKNDNIEINEYIKAKENIGTRAADAFYTANLFNKHALTNLVIEASIDTLPEAILSTSNSEARLEAPIALTTTDLQKLKDLDSSLKKLTNDFAQHNIGLAIFLAKKFQHNSYSLLDGIQDGYLALVHAAFRYDPKKGFRYSTVAWPTALRAIRSASGKQRRLLSFPDRALNCLDELALKKDAFELKYHSMPSLSELAKGIETPLRSAYTFKSTEEARIKELIERLLICNEDGEAPMSVEDKWGDQHASLDLIEALENEDADFILVEKVHEAINQLSEYRQTIIKMRYGLGEYDRTYTQKEIAALYNYSINAISIQEIAATDKLKLLLASVA